VTSKNGWFHNRAQHQWELFYHDIVAAFVTDEFLKRSDPIAAATWAFNKLGSVPPPLEGVLPPFDHNEVLYEFPLGSTFVRDAVTAWREELGYDPITGE
jgi:hypothetical protein